MNAPMLRSQDPQWVPTSEDNEDSKAEHAMLPTDVDALVTFSKRRIDLSDALTTMKAHAQQREIPGAFSA